ncbi:hypothetical protein F8388_005947 [Cannabis sativa]|uniref:Protein kinase domain-containing protein n=1 Tax=Cannabis sativa TaxID=3483 RepID=A0A7J6E387_CANSA|nr:hypothetical protein F8388_005947 [Cannabis sativa]KAF4404618.1 hypothetical protein G4B88_006004 [Cannabis sativa]
MKMMRMVIEYRQEKGTFVIKYNKRQREDEDSRNNKRSKYGGWVKEKLLGRGGFGCVNLVKFKEPRPPHYKDFPELLAVKSALNNTCSKDLVREMKVYESLGSSPFIVKCYGQLDNYNKWEVNMAMEYASGGSLASAIESKNNGDGLSEWEVKAHTCSILKGLEFIHGKGLVHCDLKPANILLVADDDDNSPYSVDGFVAKIADFGLAKTSSVGSNNGDDECMRRSKIAWESKQLSCQPTTDPALPPSPSSPPRAVPVQLDRTGESKTTNLRSVSTMNVCRRLGQGWAKNVEVKGILVPVEGGICGVTIMLHPSMPPI